MKRLAFLSFTIATLIAPTQVQAQTRCVTFPPNSNPEAELRYLLSHPGTPVCLEVRHNIDQSLQRRDVPYLLDKLNRKTEATAPPSYSPK
jgi:hypothetical protein